MDNGTTWSEDFEVNEEIEGNQGTPQPSVKRHYIAEAAGVDSFRIKFTFDADYYNWILDDVQLIQPERNNLVVMDNFYAIAPNAMTPISQVDSFSFLADVYNAGSATQTNVVLDVEVDDGSSVWDASLNYGDIEGDSLAENVPFVEYFLPDGSEVKSYEGMYEVSSDSVDFDESDNVRMFSFMTSDTTFAKENGATGSTRPADNNWDDGEAHSWGYGNYYYIADGDNWNVSSATFSIGAPDVSIVGRLLEISLYKWDEDANSVADNNMDPDERTKIGTFTYEITGEETIDDLITVPLNVPPNLPGPIDIETGDHLVVAVEYNTNDENDFFMATNDERNYGAMIFRSELPEEGIAGPTSRYAGMLAINEPLTDEPYSSVGFGRDLVPVVRLNVSLVTNTEVALDPANKVEITPNPANNVINLNLDLVENQERVSIRILDVNGRLVLDQPYLNLQRETMQFDVSGYPAGAYFLHFITESGVRTERFIVQH